LNLLLAFFFLSCFLFFFFFFFFFSLICVYGLSECCSQSVKYAWVCESSKREEEEEEDYIQNTRDREREKNVRQTKRERKGWRLQSEKSTHSLLRASPFAVSQSPAKVRLFCILLYLKYI
jgi:hypothetical protein